MEYNVIKVSNAQNKEKIYSYLRRIGYSENYIKNLRKKEGYILKNDQVAHSDYYVNDNDILKLCKNPNTTTGIMLCTIPLNIVYEDDDVLVVNKPSGISISPSKSHYTENMSGAILSYMIKKDPNFVVRIVGRLDMETCGLFVVAKHSVISSKLSLDKQLISKVYYAIVTGSIDENIVIDKNIDTSIGNKGYNDRKRIISDSGKPAITYVSPVLFDGNNTLCRITIEHGRTHQIRLHLSSINHPLLGDSLYGVSSDRISHTALICKELKIVNPFTNKEIALSVDFPDDFKNAFNVEL